RRPGHDRRRSGAGAGTGSGRRREPGIPRRRPWRGRPGCRTDGANAGGGWPNPGALPAMPCPERGDREILPQLRTGAVAGGGGGGLGGGGFDGGYGGGGGFGGGGFLLPFFLFGGGGGGFIFFLFILFALFQAYRRMSLRHPIQASNWGPSYAPMAQMRSTLND